MGLIAHLGSGPIALDTACFIYFLEQHPDYSGLLRPLFAAADREEIQLVTSAVTLLEVLVVPYRAGNTALAARYEALLTRSRGVTMVAVDRTHMRMAAQLRVRTAVRTPDALQLSAALISGCSTFVTNDRRLPTWPTLRVVQLSDVV